MPLGCAKYTSRPLDAGGRATAFTGRSLSDDGLRKFLAQQGAAGGSWNVERLALAAVYFHGDVAVARAVAEEAEAGIKTAGQSPNPVLTFSPAYDTTAAPAWILGGTIDVPIETAGKRGKRLAEARAMAEAANFRMSVAAWDARTKVRAALLDLYTAQENSALLTTEVALHQEAVTKLDAQVKAGAASAFELIQERLGFNRSRLALHDAEKLSGTSRAQLAAAVGVSSAALEAAALDFSAFTSLPPAPGSGVRRRALVNRADLLAALADYAAADAELRLQIAKQYPDVHLQPGYLLDQTDNKWSLGLSIELPIINQNRGPIAQASARRKTVGTTFEAKQASVFGEIEIALAAYRAARAKAATADTLAEEAAQASDTTKRMVDAGELVPLELTRRRIEASAANLSRLEARAQAQQAVGALEAALQTPLRTVK
ncbi:TolC family protein [Chthoniobacter sp.]|uniref:TolC family protein n=1 Tax=Chthoniobacter sp. TaxID=2510640 RepID=UPI0032AEE763